jgi:hypothetical protein
VSDTLPKVPGRATQGDRSALQSGSQANIARPHLRESHEIGGDDDISISGEGFEVDIDMVRTAALDF